MKLQKEFALLLALVLLLGILAGCAGKESADTAAEPAAAIEETAQEAPAEEAAQNAEAAEPERAEEPASKGSDTAASPEKDASPVLFEEEVNVTADHSIEYPLSDGSATIDFWLSFSSMVQDFGDSYTDFPGVLAIQEATGVTLNLIEVSESAATEQYQLMVASGDWPDISNTENYTGEAITAYTEEVILDLTEMLPEYAPDMWSYTAALPDDIYAGMFSDGMILGALDIEYNSYQDEGTVIRKDWLDDLGLSVPTSFDEMIDCMYAFYDAYRPDHCYKLSNDGGMVGMQDVFDTAFASLDASSSGGVGFFLRGDTVVCSGTNEGYHDYLELLTQLYADGLIYADFYSEQGNMSTGMAMVANGQIGVWSDRANNVEECFSYVTDDEDFDVVCLPYFTGDDGVNNYVNSPYRVTTVIGVYTTSEDPELVLNFLNYPFTDEGILLCNYGTEGVSFEYDENGEPQFTDAVLNPTVGNSNTANQYYVWNQTGTYEDKGRLLVMYSDFVIDIIDTWNDWSVLDWSANIPDAAALDANEQASVTNTLSDLGTIEKEYLLGFVTGSKELNDENWNAYVDLMNANGLQEVTDVYQKAYDDYLRELTVLR